MALSTISDVYFGIYAQFSTPSRKEGAIIAGPDYAIGDIGTIEWRLDENKQDVAWLKNPYGACFGFLNHAISYKLAVLKAKGWIIKYVLSFCAQSEESHPSTYWGEVAIIAYAPRYAESFEPFLPLFAKRCADGLRPNPDLSDETINQLLTGSQKWQPSQKVRLPKEATIILKDHRTLHDRLLDCARKKTVLGYAIGWLFIGMLVFGAFWLVKSMGII